MLAVSIEHASDEAGNQCGDIGWMQASIDVTTVSNQQTFDFRLALTFASFCFTTTQPHTIDRWLLYKQHRPHMSIFFY